VNYEVPGLINHLPTTAFPDNGTSNCCISEKFSQVLGLTPNPGTEKQIKIGSGKEIRSLGNVEVEWSFANETSMAYRIPFAVIRGCSEHLILGSKFLDETATMTKFFAKRVSRKVSSLLKNIRLGFKLCGDTRERVWGSLNGHKVLAVPDFGSDAMLLSERYARELGLEIDYSPEHQLELEFADGSTRFTQGIVHGMKWQFGDEGEHICADFYVLEGMPVDVVLSKHFLVETDAFTERNEFFLNLEFEQNLSELLSIRLVRSLGKNVGRVCDIRFASRQDYSTTPPPIHRDNPSDARHEVLNQFSGPDNKSRQLHHVGLPCLKYNEYTVGVISVMHFEMSAVRYMLDEEHGHLRQKTGDPNIYTSGKLRGHNVVIGCLPGTQGKGSAAITATHMHRTFPAVRYWFLVGIGGGAPSAKDDIRWGDVVISMPNGRYSGVVEYDSGRETETDFDPIGFLASPPPILRSTVEKMRSDHMLVENKIDEYVSALVQRGGRLDQYMRPSEEDVLFEPGYTHPPGQDTCSQCDKSRAINRQPRKSIAPAIHYGLVASGDRVMKNPIRRDKLGQAFGVKCFEMEAAGVMADLPALVIRGISDYCDSHKGYKWQRYAAATAAGCLKELLGYLNSD
jgi:nucleoside phosphorylase